jgi:hypothetical protein
VRLFRVLPYDVNAAPDEKGGVFYRPGSAAGRIANPDLYRELYFGCEPESAIAETFGRLPVWHSADFIHSGGRTLALATYQLPDAARIFNLDDRDALKSIKVLRPSEVVTRDRPRTRAWAREIFQLKNGDYVGASWWCFYNPDWRCVGLWHTPGLQCVGIPQALGIKHAAVRSAAATIVRQLA